MKKSESSKITFNDISGGVVIIAYVCEDHLVSDASEVISHLFLLDIELLKLRLIAGKGYTYDFVIHSSVERIRALLDGICEVASFGFYHDNVEDDLGNVGIIFRANEAQGYYVASFHIDGPGYTPAWKLDFDLVMTDKSLWSVVSDIEALLKGMGWEYN